MALKKNLDVTIHEAFLEEILQGNWKPGQALNLTIWRSAMASAGLPSSSP